MSELRLQFRRGKADFWTDENPVLRTGEPGYETDTRLFKIGDGVTPWRELPYSSGVGASLPPELYDELVNDLTSQIAPQIEDAVMGSLEAAPSLFLIYQNAKV